MLSRTIFVALAALGSATAFTASLPAVVSSSRRHHQLERTTWTVHATAMAEAGIPPSTSEPTSDVKDIEIPTNLPSDCGMDYVPLATLLATGELAEADQVRTLLCVFVCVCVVRLRHDARKKWIHHDSE